MLRLLSSIKLAAVLIAALAIASIFATLYPHLNIYENIGFRGLLIAFTINLFTCTIRSIPAAYRKVIKKGFDIETVKKQEPLQVPDVENSQKALEQYLQKKGYKIYKNKANDGTSILAKKGLLNLAAPHLLHVALIVVLIGAFVGSFGSSDNVMSFVGDSADIPSHIAKDMTVYINDFQTIYDKDGAVDNWVSDITLYVNGEKVAQGTTRVNHPFKYKGVVFYQSSYGYTHIIAEKETDGNFFAIPDGKMFNVDDIVFNIRYTPEGALLKVYQNHQVIKGMYLANGDEFELPDGSVFEYVELYPFTILSVKVDPGTNIVMAGFILMIIASTMFWTGRYREVQCYFSHLENKVHLLVVCKNKDMKNEVANEIAGVIGEER